MGGWAYERKIEKLKERDCHVLRTRSFGAGKRNVDAGRLIFTLDYHEAVVPSDIIFIAVGTPPKASGSTDLSSVFSASESIAKRTQRV